MFEDVVAERHGWYVDSGPWLL